MKFNTSSDYSQVARQFLSDEKFDINNNSPNVEVENPSLVHKMEHINSLSKIPAMRFLGVFLPPAKLQVPCRADHFKSIESPLHLTHC